MTGCRANSDPRVVADKLARVKDGPVGPINAYVDELRGLRAGSFIPYIDPDCGGRQAQILMLFQDPGPKAASGDGSGMLSIGNDDPSAGALCMALSEVGLPWHDVMPWNAVPWYTGGENTACDKLEGLKTLSPLVALLPELKVVVTFGGLASQSWKRACKEMPSLKHYLQVPTLHPSIRGLTRGSRQDIRVGRQQLKRDLLQAAKLRI